MPAAASNKRVKNTRISRPFIIGSKAWTLTPENNNKPVPEGHTKGWTIYVRGIQGGPDLSTWLKKVQFKLHHTYNDASRTVESQPFQVSETGYGEFDIELRLYFDSSSGEKAQYRFHRLKLEPFGDEAQIAKQLADNAIIAETCEIVEFNEPSQEFLDKMTSEDQFVDATQGNKKGAKSKAEKKAQSGEMTAKLPGKSTPDMPFSKEMEDKVVDMLAAAKKELVASIAHETALAADRQQRMAALAS